MGVPLYNAQDLEQCLPTTYNPYNHHLPSQPSQPSQPSHHNPASSSPSSAPTPMSLYYESPTRHNHYGPGLSSTASASIVGGHFHVSSPTSQLPHLPHIRSPVVPLVDSRAEYTTSAGAPRLPSAGLPSPWSSGSTTDSFYAGMKTSWHIFLSYHRALTPSLGFPPPEAPSAPFNHQHRHSSISSQSSPFVNLNSP